ANVRPSLQKFGSALRYPCTWADHMHLLSQAILIDRQTRVDLLRADSPPPAGRSAP
ncbi:hypothetical protein P3T39_007593, partial [Kitasatospora sp. GP82]|nr:hypothetical protein [Kitasatospora sp. GP82]